MRWENILQAIVSAPAIILEQVVEGFRAFLHQERDLIHDGEFEDEAEE